MENIDPEEIQQMNEAATAAIETAKSVYRAADDEFYALQANHLKRMHTAYMTAGFSNGDSIQLMCSSLMSGK